MAEASDNTGPDPSNDLYQSSLEKSKSRLSGKAQQKHAGTGTAEMESIMLYQSNQLTPLSAPGADTLVFIGVPPQGPNQNDAAYTSITRHFDTFHKIHSKNVLSLGSAKFESLLGPSSQFRIERRLRNEGVLPGGKPIDVKYLLDLRPPSEGDDAIFLITELSCSSGVLNWCKARVKYDIPRTMVSGQDDTSLLPSIFPDLSPAPEELGSPNNTKPHAEDKAEPLGGPESLQSPTEVIPNAGTESKSHHIGNWEGVFPTSPAIPDEIGDSEEHVNITENVASDQEHSDAGSAATTNTPQTAEPETQPEYSQLRHWSAIERLLHAIEGNDPMLDSAPKVWTYFAIAKYFGCASNDGISKWITTWLFTVPNHNFIQCNPEVCYRIGLGIQSEALIKVAFSLLVGEKALMIVQRRSSQLQSSNLHVSVAGRKLELLDDDELNRIDHAAHFFIQRMQPMYDAFIGQEMLWLDESPTFGVLSSFVPHSTEEEETAKGLKDHIKSFVRSRVMWVLARDYKSDPQEVEQNPSSVRPFYTHASAQFETYNKLNQEERILSRFFWMALKSEQLELGDNSVFTPPAWKTGLPHESISPVPGWSRVARKLKTDSAGSELAMVRKDTLYRESNNFSNILRSRYWDALSKANRRRDWSNESSYPRQKHAKLLASKVCSRMQPWGDDLENSFAHGRRAETSPVSGLRNLHLSSPKRGHRTNPVEKEADIKRPRLDLDETQADGSMSNDKKIELPIRVAEQNTVPTEERTTIEVAVLQATKPIRKLGTPFAYVDAEVPVDDETEVSSWHDAAPQALPTDSSWSKSEVEKQLVILELGGEPSFLAEELLLEVRRIMQGICEEVLFAAHFFQDNEVPTNLIDSLTSLTQNEWDCLPLWAGGNDDGSGGVFDGMDVPNLESDGFGAGELGYKRLGKTSGNSDWSEVNSTVGKASKQATDGTATESATVQSMSDVDMDVRSLDDNSSVGGTETVVDRDSASVANLDSADEDEFGDMDDEDVEESDWEDCTL